MLILATAGCLAPLEHAYYDARFSESHSAVVASIRTMDAELDAYRAGEVSDGELEVTKSETHASVAEAMEPLRDPWPARWEASVTALRTAGTVYLGILDDLTGCVNGGGMPSCDGAVDGLLKVFSHLAEAQEARPSPA